MSQHPERRHSLRKSQLIDYPNVAAGHDGVKSNRSGDLIVKPCKNAEVDFYQQNWMPDPEPSDFAYYMPKFFGTLNLEENPTATSPLAPQTQASQLASQRPDTPASTTSSRAGHARAASRTVISHLPVDESLAPTEPPKSWKPRSGHKIDAENGVVLENIASGFSKPNILDIKLGARLWADDAPLEKRDRLDTISAKTTSGSVSFRIAGMKLWAGDGAYEAANRLAMDQGRQMPSASSLTDGKGGDAAPGADARAGKPIPKPSIREDDYASYDKEYGRTLTKDNVQKGLEEYFYRPPATGVHRDQAHEVIARFVEDLKGLEAVMERQETRMYSASLLFVYEGSGAALREDFRCENRMIREAREARERIEAGQEADALPQGTLRSSSSALARNLAQFTMTAAATPGVHTTVTHASGEIPSLPQIDVDSSLGTPAQLVMTDAQIKGTGQHDARDEDDEDDEDDDEEKEDLENTLPKIQTVKMIDFAHATSTPGQGPDRNVLRGIRNVIQVLESLLADGDGDD